MEPIRTIRGIAAPLLMPNIDTDVIIRIDAVARHGRDGLGPHALAALRYLPDGRENPDCVLNQPVFREAVILVAGRNFGCGSSRENAVWALMAMGIRAIIAPSFGDIFYGNCFQNGLLPIRLGEDALARLAAQLDPQRDPLIAIDLPEQRITGPDGGTFGFEIEPLGKRMLVAGLDAIGFTLQHTAAITSFQSRDRETRPWLYRNWNA